MLDALFWGPKASPCSLDVLYGGLQISKLQFWINKEELFSDVFFFFNFGHQNPDSLECWVRIWTRIQWIPICSTGKFSPAWCGWGMHAYSFHSIYHHEQSCGVRSSWEGRNRLLFLIYPFLLSGSAHRIEGELTSAQWSYSHVHDMVWL